MKRIKSEGKTEISPLDELKKLKELLDIGAITPQEYEEKKRKLLRKI
ncbi:MAG: hypothetical protein DRJ30_04810 [Candidatus Methanomethylicota archaeon]|nr:MAG: hypothetical protein DRJ30_04810 [Candidatus Verstraetearchaeota archaeon]